MRTIIALIICLVCASSASATNDLTAIANGLRGPVKSSKSVLPGVASEYLEYDRQGRVVKEVTRQGLTVIYKWDDDNTVTASVYDKNGAQEGVSLTYAWIYQDNTFTVKFSEDEYVSYQDDGNGRLINKIVVADGKTGLYNYKYGEDGLLKEVHVTLPNNNPPEIVMSVTGTDLDSYGNPAKQAVKMDFDGQVYTTLSRYTYYED